VKRGLAASAGGEARFEVNHVVALTVLAQFVGDAFLCFRKWQDGIEHIEAFQEIGEAATVAIHLDERRQFLRVVSRQLDAEFIGEFGDGRNANRAVEVQVQINFGQGFEIHGAMSAAVT
jgi:hypothetical protein